MVKVRQAVGRLLNILKPEPLKPTLLNTAHMVESSSEEAAAMASVQSFSVLPPVPNQALDAVGANPMAEVTTTEALEAFAMMDALKGAESASLARAKAVEEALANAKAEENVIPLFPAFSRDSGAEFARNVSVQLAAAEATQAALQQLEKLAEMAGKPLDAASPQEVKSENALIEDALIIEDIAQDAVIDEMYAEQGPVDPLSMPPLVREKYIAHQLWLETEGREGKRFRYMAEDMRGQRFSGLNLSQAQFRGEDLYGMQFDGADLRGADFSDCNVQRSNFSQAQLEGANFSRANLAFANFNEVKANRSNFTGANLEGTLLRDCQFADANLRDANFQGTVAMHSVFARAQLRNASFLEAILEKADFSDADMRGCQMVRGLLTETRFDNANFKGAVLEDIDFSASDFTLANDVAEEYQRTALAIARGKIQSTRETLEHIQETLKRREYRIHQTARELSNRLQQMRQLEGQENKLLEIIRKQGRWMRNSGFWWAAVVMVVCTVSWLALRDMTAKELNIGAIAALATFNVVVIALSVMSFYRSVVVCRSVQGMMNAREQYSNQLTGLEQEFASAPEFAPEVQSAEVTHETDVSSSDSLVAENQHMMDYNAVMPDESLVQPPEGSNANAPHIQVA